jgi:hypothetical protein
MRKILFAASAIVALAIPGAASAQYYYAADAYGPPATTYVAPGTTYVAPAPGMVQSQVYLTPPAVAVAPGAAYDDQAIYIDGERYYRDCWWDWGRRRCELKRWW